MRFRQTRLPSVPNSICDGARNPTYSRWERRGQKNRLQNHNSVPSPDISPTENDDTNTHGDNNVGTTPQTATYGTDYHSFPSNTSPLSLQMEALSGVSTESFSIQSTLSGSQYFSHNGYSHNSIDICSFQTDDLSGIAYRSNRLGLRSSLDQGSLAIPSTSTQTNLVQTENLSGIQSFTTTSSISEENEIHNRAHDDGQFNFHGSTLDGVDSGSFQTADLSGIAKKIVQSHLLPTLDYASRVLPCQSTPNDFIQTETLISIESVHAMSSILDADGVNDTGVDQGHVNFHGSSHNGVDRGSFQTADLSGIAESSIQSDMLPAIDAVSQSLPCDSTPNDSVHTGMLSGIGSLPHMSSSLEADGVDNTDRDEGHFIFNPYRSRRIYCCNQPPTVDTCTNCTASDSDSCVKHFLVHCGGTCDRNFHAECTAWTLHPLWTIIDLLFYSHHGIQPIVSQLWEYRMVKLDHGFAYVVGTKVNKIMPQFYFGGCPQQQSTVNALELICQMGQAQEPQTKNLTRYSLFWNGHSPLINFGGSRTRLFIRFLPSHP